MTSTQPFYSLYPSFWNTQLPRLKVAMLDFGKLYLLKEPDLVFEGMGLTEAILQTIGVSIHEKKKKQLTKRIVTIICGWLGLFNSTMAPSPSAALGDISFSIPPYILKCGGKYYLRYQVTRKHDTSLPLQMALYSKKTDKKGYYYFSLPISHPEPGNLVERPLAKDELTEYAGKNAIYWLNPDGTEIHLKIKEAVEHHHD
jgi:hypothetical protein